MKIALILDLLALTGLVAAIPRKEASIKRRQAASNCNCQSDVSLTFTTFATVTSTSSATVSTNAGGTEVTAGTQTGTSTISRTATVQAASVVSTTRTIGAVTVSTTGSAATFTSTVTNTATTITTCVVSAYRKKRQATAITSTTATSAPSTTTVTTNFGSTASAPRTCICRLISAFPGPTPTSPACNCPPVKTTTSIISSTVTQTTVSTTTISFLETSTVTPRETSTVYSDAIITTTRTTTFTVSQSRVTTTNRSTVTTTTTVTPTVLNCPTADSSCNNTGVRWGIYANTNAAGRNNTNTDASRYSSFDPTIFKTRKPAYQNITYTLGGFRYLAAKPVLIDFYNSGRKFESDYIAINHVGYIFAVVTGTYTLTIDSSDDITMLWLGPKAYSGYTRANADIVNAYNQGAGTYQVALVAGSYTPFRIWFGNAQEAIVFQASLTAPDGTVILTSNSRASPYLVQYTCDNTTAPEFPQFGSET